jgi:hypothetical protein
VNLLSRARAREFFPDPAAQKLQRDPRPFSSIQLIAKRCTIDQNLQRDLAPFLYLFCLLVLVLYLSSIFQHQFCLRDRPIASH